MEDFNELRLKMSEIRPLLFNKKKFYEGWPPGAYSKMRRSWQNISRMVSNIREEGFVGGESGVSPKGIIIALRALARIEKQITEIQAAMKAA